MALKKVYLFIFINPTCFKVLYILWKNDDIILYNVNMCIFYFILFFWDKLNRSFISIIYFKEKPVNHKKKKKKQSYLYYFFNTNINKTKDNSINVYNNFL